MQDREKSSDYWQERFKQMEEAQNRSSIEQSELMIEQYERAERKIAGKINAWYQRFADNNGITMTEAKRMLNAGELRELKWDVQEYIAYGRENAVSQAWVKELENASARIHIRRLEALNLQIQQEIEALYGNCIDSIDAHIRKTYSRDFYHTAFEIHKGFGVGARLTGLDERLLDRVVSRPWAIDGKNFSERLWGNKTRLVNELHNSLSTMCITGESPQRVIDAFANKMKASRQNTTRLIMTESAVFANQARVDCMKELGVEEYEILETLDGITCEFCQRMDKKHFKLTDFKVGVTAPVFHPNCRGCTCPYFDDEFTSMEERAARGWDGKVYYVPADMSYKDWERTFINGNSQVRDRLGLITNNNMTNPKYYDFNGKNIGMVESDLSQFDYEVGVIFNKDGEAVCCQLGNENSIRFTKYQLSKMRGKDVTHNHPNGTPPSPEDLYLLKDYKAHSFRTTGKNGVYVLEYSEEVKNLPDFEEFSNTYDNLVEEISPKYKEEVKNGMDSHDALRKIGEDVWDRLYHMYGVKPAFKRRLK